MPKFPEPPPLHQLQGLAPVTQTCPAGTLVARVFFAGGGYTTAWNAFRHYGPTASRFDHHLPDAAGNPCAQARGIMYLATGPASIPTCLAEVFQTSRVIDRHSKNPVLCGFELETAVSLLDLTGPFATAMGASAAIHSGARPRARRWARRLYEAYRDIDGIRYCSSMYGNEPAIALFERGAGAIPSRPVFHRELRDPALAQVITETGAKISYTVV